MKCLSLLLALTFPALAQLPPVPPGAPGYVAPLHSPKHLEILSSLGSRMVKAGAAPSLTAAPVMMQLTLTWDYPADQITNVVFEVWFSTTLFAGPPLATYDAIPTGFQLAMTADGPPVKIQTNLPQQFFIVRAKDRATGAYSKWNQLVSNGPVMLETPVNGQVVSNTITLIAVITAPLNAPLAPGRLALKL